jgi:hypothetical protein
MSALDLEACTSFVAVNRLIADRFAAKAEHLLELAQSVDDIEERIRIADVIHFAENRAATHNAMAQRQERDLGVQCHCITANRHSDQTSNQRDGFSPIRYTGS